MKTQIAQRWRDGKSTYRPSGETIDTCHYEVAEIVSDKTAKSFVVEHHYDRSYPAARLRYGLFRHGALVGVAVFSVPAHPAVLSVVPGESSEAVELGRFVLLDDVPGNGETWFLARCFELVRERGIVGIVSHSDPQPRMSANGETVFRGHVGTIYQAHNAVYLGCTARRTQYLLPNGTVFSARSVSKVRSKERGWRGAAEPLVRLGASEPGEDTREWLREWMPLLTRTVRHPGNHKYVWGLTKAVKRMLPTSIEYPKLDGQLFWRLGCS